jgi:hypothetical protein
MAHRTLGRDAALRVAPGALQALLERDPAATLIATLALTIERHGRCLQHGRAHDTLRHTPTTRPSTCASRVMIGSIESFSG